VAHTYTVTNRNELLAALYTGLTMNADGSIATGTLDTSKKIIYVSGTISLNTNSASTPAENTESTYICPIGTVFSYSASAGTVSKTVAVAYTFTDYKNQYDPNGTWGTAAIDKGGDPMEVARACAMNKQKAVVKIKIPSNTSLIGVGSTAKFVRGNLSLAAGSDNIVIRNIAFEDSFDYFPQWDPTDSGGRWNSQYDTISVEGATHVWIDHCEFSDGTNHDKLYPPVFAAPYNIKEMKVQHHDGAVDVGNQSNYVTLSSNYVHDHDKTHLIGGSDSPSATNGPSFLKVTMHHNYLKGITQRQPRVRYGMVHVYNNYFSGDTSVGDYLWSVAWYAGESAKLYVENNVVDVVGASSASNVYGGSSGSKSAACVTTTGTTTAYCSAYAYHAGNLLNGAALDVSGVSVSGVTTTSTPWFATGVTSGAPTGKPSDFYTYTPASTTGLSTSVPANAGVGKL
jgi:pectate lyase